MSGAVRPMTELEVRLFTDRNALLQACDTVLSCWGPDEIDAGGLPVALDELRAAVAAVREGGVQ